MKKVKALVPLIAALALLASCDATSSSADSGSADAGSSDVDSGSELASALAELSNGFDIDISVNGAAYGSLALNDEGAVVEYDGESEVHYIPEAVADESGASEDYVAQAYVNLANEVETEVYAVTWDSMWANIFSMLSEDDFDKLSGDTYSAYLDEGSDLESYAITQLSLGAAADALEIQITLADGSPSEISLSTTAGDEIIASVSAAGDAVDTSVAPATGDSIAAIDNAIASLASLDYTVTEEYAIWDDEAADYVVYDDYTSWIMVDDATYAMTSTGEGYVAWEADGTYGVDYIDCAWISGYWVYGAEIEETTLYDWTGLIENWSIASLLFEETDVAGTYALRSDVPVLAELSYFDPMDTSSSTSDLTLSIGSDGSMVFTATMSDSYQIIVSYSDIGSTDLSSYLSADTAVYEMTMYNTGITNYFSYYASMGYDMYTSIGSSDSNVIAYAMRNVPLPVYGIYGYGFFNYTWDTFTEGLTEDSLVVGLEYGYYDYAYYYFQQYLNLSGYERSTITDLDGEEYYAWTLAFNAPAGYTYDEDGNATGYVYEEHTISVIQLGAYYTDETYSDVDVVYILKIDMFADDAAEEGGDTGDSGDAGDSSGDSGDSGDSSGSGDSSDTGDSSDSGDSGDGSSSSGDSSDTGDSSDSGDGDSSSGDSSDADTGE